MTSSNITYIKMKDPYTFNDLDYIVVSNRILLRKSEHHNSYSSHTPRIISLDEFKTRLEKLGKINSIEQYICPDSVIEITRGSIIKEDNKKYYFVLNAYDNTGYLETVVENVILQLQHSGKE